MPGFDGTGPEGRGPTGRRRGRCSFPERNDELSYHNPETTASWIMRFVQKGLGIDNPRGGRGRRY